MAKAVARAEAARVRELRAASQAEAQARRQAEREEAARLKAARAAEAAAAKAPKAAERTRKCAERQEHQRMRAARAAGSAHWRQDRGGSVYIDCSAANFQFDLGAEDLCPSSSSPIPQLLSQYSTLPNPNLQYFFTRGSPFTPMPSNAQFLLHLFGTHVQSTLPSHPSQNLHYQFSSLFQASPIVSHPQPHWLSPRPTQPEGKSEGE